MSAQPLTAAVRVEYVHLALVGPVGGVVQLERHELGHAWGPRRGGRLLCGGEGGEPSLLVRALWWHKFAEEDISDRHSFPPRGGG